MGKLLKTWQETEQAVLTNACSQTERTTRLCYAPCKRERYLCIVT